MDCQGIDCAILVSILPRFDLSASTMQKRKWMGAEDQSRKIRLAAIGDVHCAKTDATAMQSLFAPVNDIADILVLAGDLTEYGLPEEAQILAKALTALVRIPIVAVLGNHDFEAGRQNEISQILG